MKRVYLLFLMCIGFYATSRAGTYTKIVTVGETFEIDPVDLSIVWTWSDKGILSGSASFPETNGLAVSATKHNTTIVSNAWGDDLSGSYTTYSVTALQTGTYVITGSVSVCTDYEKYTIYKNGYPYPAYRVTGRRYGSFTCTVTVVDVTSICIPSEVSVNVGCTYTFSPIITDNRATTTLTWQSSQTEVATISAEGVLTAQGVGTTVITCTAHNGVSAQCVVTVNPVLATGISLSATSVEMVTGETMQLAASVLPENTTNPSVIWSSTNPIVAIVDGNGLVTAVSPGICNITATTKDGSNLSASCQVHVLGDVLYADDAVAVPSGRFVLPVQLKNVSSITGLQFELQLPEGVAVAEDNAGKLMVALSERVTDHSISASKLSNGNYQFVVFSSTSSALAGNEGAIAYITLNVDESVVVGEYAIGIKDVELTKTDGTSLHHKDLTSKLTLADAIPGDTNGDGKVTVTDAVGIVNYILHRTPSVFITKAADVNNDGSITISDAVKVINIVLNK